MARRGRWYRPEHENDCIHLQAHAAPPHQAMVHQVMPPVSQAHHATQAPVYHHTFVAASTAPQLPVSQAHHMTQVPVYQHNFVAASTAPPPTQVPVYHDTFVAASSAPPPPLYRSDAGARGAVV